jgi:hypothetical protein
MLRTRDWIKKVVQTDTIQKHIQELQEKHDITLAEVAYDPAKVVEENLMVDPFAFNNYYLHSVAMSFAIFRTLISQRGTRLWLMYHDTICHEQGGEDSSCLDTIEKEWMEMFPEDQVNWVRLILHVIWVAGEILEKELVEAMVQEAVNEEDAV